MLVAAPCASAAPQPCGPLDVVVAIDVSGSAGAQPLLAAESVAEALRTSALRAPDQLGVIAFAAEAVVLHDLGAISTRVSLRDVAPQLGRIGRKHTNIAWALAAAVTELDSHGARDALGRAAAVRLVVLVTDARVDIPGTGARETLLSHSFDDLKTAGVHVAVVSLDEQPDHEVVQALSQRTGGFAYHATSNAAPEGAAKRLVAWRTQLCGRALDRDAATQPGDTTEPPTKTAKKPVTVIPPPSNTLETPLDARRTGSDDAGVGAQGVQRPDRRSGPGEEPNDGSAPLWPWELGGVAVVGLGGLLLARRGQADEPAQAHRPTAPGSDDWEQVGDGRTLVASDDEGTAGGGPGRATTMMTAARRCG